MWTRDNVQLETVWHSGLIAAEKTLRTHGIYANFNEKLSRPEVDFMKPRGDAYPGVSSDPDRSTTASTGVPPPTSGGQPTGPRTHEDQLADPDLVNMGLGDLLSSPDANGNIQTSEDRDTDWLAVPNEDGSDPKELHKASIVSALFNPAGGRLSVDRLRRLRGYPRVFRVELGSKELSGEDILNVGDTVLAPICSLDSVAAGFIQVKGIEQKGSHVAQVTEVDLEQASMEVVVSGQVLSMCLGAASSDDNTTAGGTSELVPGPPIEASQSNQPAPDSASDKWIWTGESVCFLPANAGAATRTAQKTEDGTQNALMVQVPGSFTQPVDLAIAPITVLPPTRRKVLYERGVLHTCTVDHKALQELTATMFKTIDPNALLRQLTRYGPATESRQFPYLDQHSE
ncbi:hypothetical protein EVJ58_g9856 [Rhodofomes roseus]|uniref:Uncharacterized protein n=1 Tax=Rhodofomes roseus TaxID=34475 RepID=A0A4Y9XRL8_9APHY|nr:hypothetical protein EVJ58_g9856 [Rhodofomes roseus]